MSESQTPRTDEAVKQWAPNEGVSTAFARQLETELTATRSRLAELEGAVRREINYALIEAEYPCNRHSGEGYGMRKVAERIQKSIKAYKEGKK